MNWSAMTAVGTILAAFVGVAGIWTNYHEKTKKLSIKYEPLFALFIANNSLRSVIVTKMVFAARKHVFYVDVRSGLQEIKLNPSSLEQVYVNEKEMSKSFEASQMGVFCNPTDKVVITVHDNYKRRYNIKTDITIGMIQDITSSNEL